MSRIITPSPPPNSARKSIARIEPLRAAGERHEQQRHGKHDAAEEKGGPIPIRGRAASSRPTRSALRPPPLRARARASPGARSASGRVQDEERVEDEVEEVDRRGREERGAHDRAQDVAHARDDVASRLLGRRLLGSIEERNAAEKRYEIESTSSAYGAFSICTRMPPTLGPATNENARLPASSELASRSVALDERHEERRSRRRGRRRHRPDEEGDDVQLRDRQRVERVRDRDRHDNAARARSVTIIVCRLRPRRSTQAPACRAKRRFGRARPRRGSPSAPRSRRARGRRTAGARSA